MIRDFETPTDFNSEYSVGNIEIKYNDLHEFSQGGPQIGTLSINNKIIYGRLFGGPSLLHGQYLYVPEYVKKFMGWGFRLIQIDCISLDVKPLGKAMALVFLNRIENNNIYYFKDVSKTKLDFIKL